MWTLGTGSTYQSSTVDAYQSGFYMGASDQTNLAATSSATWQLAGVSFVVGDSAPVTHPYESYSENLQRCQRYFEKTAAPNASLIDTSSGYINIRDGTASTVVRYYSQRYSVVKRAVPTVTVYDAAGNTGKVRLDSTNNLAANLFGSGASGFALYATSGGISHYGIHYGFYAESEL
jgi:hypothetical protein